MRFLSSILAFVLGLVALGAGIGQLTVWAPETSTVVQSDEIEDEAPLTIITEDVVDPDEERDTFTIEAEGEYTVALARLHDIEAWVGDAAHVRVDGVTADGEGGADWDAEYVDGESEVQNPSDSDMWVATETTEGELDYQWAAPQESGEWALLLFRDGSEPAPAQFSTEITQEQDTALPVTLIVLGALGILIAIVLFYRALAGRRAEEGTVEQGTVEETRASKSPSGDQTSADETSSVETSAGKTADGEAVEENTVAAAPAAEGVDGQTRADEPVAPDAEDETTVIPTTAPEPETQEQDVNGDQNDVKGEGDSEGPQGGWKRSSVATVAAVAIALSPAALSTADAEADDPADDQTQNGAEDEDQDSAAEDVAEEAPSEEDEAAEGEDEPAQDESAQDEPAEDETAETPDAEEEISEGDGTPEEEADTEEYSVLVDSQLDRILEDIAEVVAEGDEAGDAELLEDRVAGNALDVRELTYRNSEIDEDVSPDPIGTEVLSAAVTSEQEFPRQVLLITQHEDMDLPQVLMLEQESARENYKLTQAVVMDPAAEFPGFSVEEGGIGSVSPESETARFPADFAMERTAVYLNNAEYYFGVHVQDSAYIEDLQDYQQEVRDSAPDVTVSYTRPLNDAAALRLPDGSVLAVGSFDATEQLRPTEPGAAINFGESGLLNELAGTSSTTADTDILSRESLILHIPADEGDQITVLGVDYIVSDVNINE